VKIFLTGACGYTGSVLYEKLRARGDEVIGCDTQWFGNYLDTKYSGVDYMVVDEPEARLATGNQYGDIKTSLRRLSYSVADKIVIKLGKKGAIGIIDDPVPYGDVRAIRELPSGTDAVIHLAAIANDPSVAYFPRKSWETGVLATMQLCEAAIKAGCKRFVYASSVSVYGADRGKVTESAELRPLSDYNKTKMAAERVLMSYSMMMNIAMIRPATVCGLSPRMRTDLTVNMFCMQALERGVITVHGGEQYRPSIHIDDLTDLYIWMLDNPHVVGAFNAGFENLKLIEIAERVRENIPCRIEVTDQRDTRSYQVNSDKLLTTTEYRPKKNINDAIFELWNAYQDGNLRQRKQWNNLEWMKELGVQDD
jgi:nucleoside-diphosphate-sugar epimerase